MLTLTTGAAPSMSLHRLVVVDAGGQTPVGVLSLTDFIGLMVGARNG